MRSHVSRAWYLFAELTSDVWKMDEGVTNLDTGRIKQMIAFINKNFQDKITLIGEKCGFNTSSYFGRVFKEKMECTPREFRKKYTV